MFYMTEVLILGAGYAGLRTLKILQQSHTDFHITLVDQNNYHYEATDLHELATGNQPKERILYNISDVIKPDKTTFIQGEVVNINRDDKNVSLKDGKKLSYDYLVVSLGFESESFGIDGVEENALEMVNIDSAESVQKHILARMEDYRESKNPDDLKIVVCGAGFTGIELLGALHEATPKLAKTAGVDPKEIQLYCVEAVTRLLPMFDEKLAGWGIDKLKSWGINFLTGKPIKAIKPNTVVYEDDAETGTTSELKANTIIWTTGVRGSHVMNDSGFSQRRGRVMVKADLTDPDFANVYILGDVSAVMDEESKRPYPTTAQIAIAMGTQAAENIENQLNNKPTSPFKFKSLGSVASIGNTQAFGLVGKTPVRGYPASVVKKGIMDRSLFELGGTKEVMSKGRFDFYH